jgi:hypothetical protein
MEEEVPWNWRAILEAEMQHLETHLRAVQSKFDMWHSYEGLVTMDVSRQQVGLDETFAAFESYRYQYASNDKNNTLKINLDENHLTDETCGAIIAAIIDNESIRRDLVELTLAGNDLTEEIVPSIVQILDACSNLVAVDLTGNFIDTVSESVPFKQSSKIVIFRSRSTSSF